MKAIDMIGKKIGALLVVKESGVNNCRQKLWECICDCGNTCIVNGSCMRKKSSTSCGCRILFRKKPKDRFLSYIHKSDSCWEWIGPVFKNGGG